MYRRYFVSLILLSLVPSLISAQTADSKSHGLVSYAGAMKPMDLPKLVDQSGAIVVAEVTRLLDSPGEYIRNDEPSKAMLCAAEVNVREALKGPVKPGKLVVGGLLPIPPGRKPPLVANTVRIFLLVLEQGSWHFADPFYAVLIAAPVTPRPIAGSPYDNVVEQMLAALSSNLVSAEEKRKLISQFTGISDPRLVPALRAQLEQSRDDNLTASLLSSLIMRGDQDSLAKARQIIKTSNSPAAGLLLMAIARLNRVDLLPEVAAGLQSPVQGVKGMAVLALAESPLREANPPLFATLDSPDRRLVTQLMISLAARFKRPEWAPYWDDDPQWEEMLQHWRQFKDNPSAANGPVE